MKKDWKKEMTNQIIELLEKGGNEFRHFLRNNPLPVNGITNKAYSGFNTVRLLGASFQHGFDQNVWFTFNQAKSVGANIKKGSKGTYCAFFKMIDMKDDDGEVIEGAKIPLLSPFVLFNITQVENLPQEIIDRYTSKKGEVNIIEEAEKILHGGNPTIRFGGTQAFFNSDKDYIQMPHKEDCISSEFYYSVALHEKVHWTGHKTRLNRDFSGRFGSESYAFEELVAELGSAFLCGHLGLSGALLENHAAYLDSWLQILKNDKNAIFTASAQASKAFDYLLDLANQELKKAA